MSIQAKPRKPRPLPSSFDQLVRLMPPRAIADDQHHQDTLEMIDRLMQIDDLSQGQADYLETLLELAESYEARSHPIETSRIRGRRMLKYVLEESGMSASDLARLVGVHPTMGSKILKGERRLTWEHAKALSGHFKVAPALFMD